jgi:hypothetical protein
MIVLGLALVFSAGGLFSWWNKTGHWLLMITTGIGLVLIWRDICGHPENESNDGEQSKDPFPDVEPVWQDNSWGYLRGSHLRKGGRT